MLRAPQVLCLPSLFSVAALALSAAPGPRRLAGPTALAAVDVEGPEFEFAGLRKIIRREFEHEGADEEADDFGAPPASSAFMQPALGVAAAAAPGSGGASSPVAARGPGAHFMQTTMHQQVPPEQMLAQMNQSQSARRRLGPARRRGEIGQGEVAPLHFLTLASAASMSMKESAAPVPQPPRSQPLRGQAFEQQKEDQTSSGKRGDALGEPDLAAPDPKAKPIRSPPLVAAGSAACATIVMLLLVVGVLDDGGASPTVVVTLPPPTPGASPVSSTSSMDGGSPGERQRHAKVRRAAHTMTTQGLQDALRSQLVPVKLSGLAAGAERPCWGLTEEVAEEKRHLFGQNKMTPPKKPNMWWLLIKQVFGGVFNVLLWICVVCEVLIALFLGGDDLVTPAILSFVVVSAGVLQWWTEQQAEATMNALQRLSGADSVSVFRNSSELLQPMEISTEDLIPGDVILLEAGQRVPADVRIVDNTDGALVESSAITGESLPEKRQSAPVTLDPPPPITDATNIAWSGTSVVQGRMLCVVFGTGDDTLLGQIASKIRTSRTRSSLEIQIEHFVHLIAIVATIVGILSLAVGFLLSGPDKTLGDVLASAATAFFTQVPEGLMPTVTFCLMIASKEMARRHVLVRRIDAVETLGCVGVLCSDKTGTLTSGHMTVTDLVVPSGDGVRVLAVPQGAVTPQLARLAQGGLLNRSAKENGDGQLSGSPTEVAIVVACKHMLDTPVGHAQTAEPLVFEVPFNSTNKWMLTVHAVPHEDLKVRMILKGAPERVLERCQMSEGADAAVKSSLEQLMSQGKRMICVAELRTSVTKDFVFSGSSFEDANFPTKGFEFTGLFALEDPPKEGVQEAIARMSDAGCTTIMVTGDHPKTAKAIALRIGVIREDEDTESSSGESAEEEQIRATFRTVTGTMIESNAELDEDADLATLAAHPESNPEVYKFWTRCVKYTRVFARVSPMHKRTIVQAYQHFGGHIVAMTGDGVNDAPALKEAEVGIAMGIRGTEVAKEAADIVLLDDDLSSVVAGMEQGRLCSENLRKSILYTLCSKVPQALPTFAQLLGVPLALAATHVLLIDIGTDIWTAIAYACQPAETALMERPPRHPKKEKMVTKDMLWFSFGYLGVLQSLMCWTLFFSMPQMMSLTQDRVPASRYTNTQTEANISGMTMYYWALVMGQVGAALATTTTQSSLFTYGLPNMALNVCLVLEISLSLEIIYNHTFEDPFNTRALPFDRLLLGTAACLVIIFVEECRKWRIRQPIDQRRRSSRLSRLKASGAYNNCLAASQLLRDTSGQPLMAADGRPRADSDAASAAGAPRRQSTPAISFSVASLSVKAAKAFARNAARRTSLVEGAGFRRHESG